MMIVIVATAIVARTVAMGTTSAVATESVVLDAGSTAVSIDVS